MATRLWGSLEFLSRRGSGATADEDAGEAGARKSRVPTLCAMRPRSHNGATPPTAPWAPADAGNEGGDDGGAAQRGAANGSTPSAPAAGGAGAAPAAWPTTPQEAADRRAAGSAQASAPAGADAPDDGGGGAGGGQPPALQQPPSLQYQQGAFGPGTPPHGVAGSPFPPPAYPPAADAAEAMAAAAAARLPGGLGGGGFGGAADGAGLLLGGLLLGELQRAAGLNEQQAAAAASLLQRFAPGASPGAYDPGTPSRAACGAWPPTAAAAPNPFLAPGGPTPSAFAAAAGGFGAASAALAAFDAAGGGLAGGAALLSAGGGFAGPALPPFAMGLGPGFDSANSSAAANAVPGLPPGGDAGSGSAGASGSGFAAMGGAAGFATLAAFALDGLDVPGTAQVAVHNVPFKWCNADLESLFRCLPGYLDAQLLFHENGRSKGVGVALFADTAAAGEACARLGGAQADGRKLELVLMSPDNHISFSCKQVAVLGLPWEYTKDDVRALIEAAAEAEGQPPAEAGVEAVEVAYRDDGKSEGRAIATFRSRRQAHDAITRLHGRETLAGLRMRLGAPGAAVAAAAVGGARPDPGRAPAAPAGTPPAGGGSGAAAGGNADGSDASAGPRASDTGGGATPGGDEASSARSSFDKDQGPVILHVSGLMESTTREQLRELFSQAGEVTKVDIPDGGRSMGYGFITFANAQAAEQAMLLFNNYPLSGGAIHLSAPGDGGWGGPRGGGFGGLPGLGLLGMAGGLGGLGAFGGGFGGPARPPGFGAARRGASPGGALLPGLGLGLDDPLGPGGALGGGLGSGVSGLQGLGPARHSFDHPGYASPRLGPPRGRAPGAGGAGLAPGGRGGRGAGFGPPGGAIGGLPGQLGGGGGMMMGGPGMPGPGGPGGFDTASLEQLLLQVGDGGYAGCPPGAFGPHAGAASPFAGGRAPGTPQHGGGGFGPPGGGLFGTPGHAGMGGFGAPGSAGPAFASPGLGGLFGFSPHPPLGGLGLGFGGAPAPRPRALAPARAAAARSRRRRPSAGGSGGQPGRQVVATGLPPGLGEAQVQQLFQICGAVSAISKPDQDIALVTFDAPESARKAVQLLDGTTMPSGGCLSVAFAPSSMHGGSAGGASGDGGGGGDAGGRAGGDDAGGRGRGLNPAASAYVPAASAVAGWEAAAGGGSAPSAPWDAAPERPPAPAFAGAPGGPVYGRPASRGSQAAPSPLRAASPVGGLPPAYNTAAAPPFAGGGGLFGRASRGFAAPGGNGGDGLARSPGGGDGGDGGLPPRGAGSFGRDLASAGGGAFSAFAAPAWAGHNGRASPASSAHSYAGSPRAAGAGQARAARRAARAARAAHLLLLLAAAAALGSDGTQAPELPLQVEQELEQLPEQRQAQQAPEQQLPPLQPAELWGLDVSALVDPEEPFASAHAVGAPAGLAGLFRSGLGGAWRGAFARAPPPRRGNATHRFSHTLQLDVPQPWDAINMSQIVRDNLEPDMLFWQQLEYVPTVADLFELATRNALFARLPNTRRLVEIAGGALRFPLMPPGRAQTECDESCDPQLHDFVEAMRDAGPRYNVTLPDVLFLLNTDDAPMCNQEQVMRRECTAPVISLAKEVRMADLVAPVMKRSDAEVRYRSLPWHEKESKAFFRLVARLAQVNFTGILDAGLVEAYDRPDQVAGDPVLRDGNGSLPVLPRVSMDDLPKYKWLLNLDGHVAAYRLAQLLATNSLVFKQQSSQVEFYYRSLRPFHHFVPIFKTSEHDLLPRLAWAAQHEALARRIVANANAFALTFTTRRARVTYWAYVLHAYRRLVEGQGAYFAARFAAAAAERGGGPSHMEVLLRQQLAGMQL
ncbi:hypothetical protein HT031_006442 [Scenedesmus sp. PABB004]|nr:hypothetical protein HT031_006442 [Scenedesmus sp. PABB004]